MNLTRRINKRSLLLMAAILTLTMASRLTQADTGNCSGTMLTLPFADVPAGNIFFCSIAGAYFSGLTNGTTPTTYDPAQFVTREQMAAFVTRTLDQSLKRGSTRAALGQWWRPTSVATLRPILFISTLTEVVCDGVDLWVSSPDADSVFRIDAISGRVVQNWSGFFPNRPGRIAVAGRRIFIAAENGSGPGSIYVIDPEDTPGAAALFESSIGARPGAVTFDGTNLWTANSGTGIQGTAGISRIRIADALDSTFTAGFFFPRSILWDGSVLWVLDQGPNPSDDSLKEVNPSTGAVISTISIPEGPTDMIFDGTNLWISNSTAASITIVRAVGSLKGTVLQTITGNGLNGCTGLAFDGERVLVTNSTGNSVSLFKATDFTPLGNLSTGAATEPRSVCSDGTNFWLVLPGNNSIVRF